MNDYEPDFNYDQDDYIEDDIISQLNDTSIRDNLSPETQQLINNFKRRWQHPTHNPQIQMQLTAS